MARKKAEAKPDAKSEAKPEAEAKTEAASEEAKEKTAEPEIKVKRVPYKERVQAKCSSINESFGKKFPAAHAKTNYCFNYLTEVWEETFPSGKSIASTKIEKRKERAKFIRELEEKAEEMDPEELEEYMESIPEWKRGALVVTNNAAEEEEVRGLFSRLKSKLGDRIYETDAYQRYKESDEYKELKKVRAEVRDFRADVKD